MIHTTSDRRSGVVFVGGLWMRKAPALVRPTAPFRPVAARIKMPRMDAYRVIPVRGPLDATVQVPGSKSLTNRALVAAALADGRSTLTNVLFADDTRYMLDALAALGVPLRVDEAATRVDVTGSGGQWSAGEAEIFCGNAGTVMRFLAAACCVGNGEYRLDGVPRMRERPIGSLVDALRELGAVVGYPEREGYPPIEIRACHLRGGTVSFHSPPSSQLVSALLMAAPYAQNDVFIEIAGEVVSWPYLAMTQAVMDAFGVPIVADNWRKFIVPAPQRYRGTQYAVEPDASNASYFLAAPAIAGGRVTVAGLGTSSVQGDVGFVDVLEQMGCRIKRSPNELTVHGPATGRLRGVDVDLNTMPDTAQTLAVAALFAEGPTQIRNVANLRVKETDRIAALATELRKLGATVDEIADGLTIHPPQSPTPAEIDTYDDHRMAMSFALAGLRIDGVVIRDPGCTSKTFPDYFQRLERMYRNG